MQRATYPCSIRGMPAEIAVDLTARATAPDPARPALLYVWASAGETDEAGLPTPEARESIDSLEARLVPAVVAGLGARSVGRVLTAGRVELYWYAPGSEGFGEVVVPLLDDRDADLGSHDDPQWTHYLEFLSPSEALPSPDGLPGDSGGGEG
jgi:hypothetical protein